MSDFISCFQCDCFCLVGLLYMPVCPLPLLPAACVHFASLGILLPQAFVFYVL